MLAAFFAGAFIGFRDHYAMSSDKRKNAFPNKAFKFCPIEMGYPNSPKGSFVPPHAPESLMKASVELGTILDKPEKTGVGGMESIILLEKNWKVMKGLKITPNN